MAQDINDSGGNSFELDNVTFPTARAKLNTIFDAVRTNNSGTSAPTTQYAGQFWIDTTTTTWTLYIHDGTDDIPFCTIDTSANTVNFTDSALDVVTDTTPQLGGNLDLNSNDITGTGNINITGTATVTGLTTTGDINFGDNDKANFGASNDLQIYHDGSNSIIHDNGTGNLRIRATNFEVANAEYTKSYIFASDGGAVQLNYDNSKKFETTSSGIDVTGTVVADLISINDASPEGSGITINQGANDDIILSLKSSDVAHGVTTLAETDTFGLFKKSSGNKGGLKIQGFTDALGGDGGIELEGIINSDSSAYNGLIFNGALANGTGITSLADTTNIAKFKNNGTDKLTIRGNGNLDMTSGGGNIILANGAGIDFSATANGSGTTSSEILDDYEEGTWTPEYDGDSGSFSSVTYDNFRTGRYTKIGRMVFAYGFIRTDAISLGTLSGTLKVTGLPFTALSTGQPYRFMTALGTRHNFNGAIEIVGSAINDNSTEFFLTKDYNTGSSVQVTDLGTGTNQNHLQFTAIYETA